MADAITNTIFGTLSARLPARGAVVNIATVLLGTAVLAASAKVSVPVWPIAVTLQSFAVAVLAGALGWRLGVATVAAYLLEGALGLPVFATGGGLHYLMGPSAGFLLGFLPMAFIIGRAAESGLSRRPVLMAAAILTADAVLFALGFLWLLALGTSAAWLDQSDLIGSAFRGAVQPFLVWDALKMIFAAVTLTGGLAALQRR